MFQIEIEVQHFNINFHVFWIFWTENTEKKAEAKVLIPFYLFQFSKNKKVHDRLTSSLNLMYIYFFLNKIYSLISYYCFLLTTRHCANNWNNTKETTTTKLNIYILIWDSGSYYSLFVIRVLCVVHICRVECNYEIIML